MRIQDCEVVHEDRCDVLNQLLDISLFFKGAILGKVSHS